MAFRTPLDIANRGLQIIGQRSISQFLGANRNSSEVNNCYDSLRLAELERNTWRFAIRRARVRPLSLATQLFQPADWLASNDYIAGQIASFASTTYANAAVYNWTLMTTASTGEEPDTSPKWSHYFGPMTAELYDATQQYDAGELVIIPEDFDAGHAYIIGDVIASASIFYISNVNSNTGHTPASSPTQWSVFVPPMDSGGVPTAIQLTSVGDGPLVFVAKRATTTDPRTSLAQDWVLTPGALEQLEIIWPIDAGPAFDPRTLNLYKLPTGWLSPVPYDPKQDRSPWLGVPTGPMPDDFVYEGGYIVSHKSEPITLRFVADIADVNAMNPMFCEGLAAMIGMQIAPSLESEKVDRQNAERQYNKAMGEARTRNLIILGAPAPELDDFITCRF